MGRTRECGLRDVERFIMCYGATDAERSFLMEYALKGEAYMCWCTLEDKGRAPKTWRDFERGLMTRFSRATTAATISEEEVYFVSQGNRGYKDNQKRQENRFIGWTEGIPTLSLGGVGRLGNTPAGTTVDDGRPPRLGCRRIPILGASAAPTPLRSPRYRGPPLTLRVVQCSEDHCVHPHGDRHRVGRFDSVAYYFHSRYSTSIHAEYEESLTPSDYAPPPSPQEQLQETLPNRLLRTRRPRKE
ncbi:hypothetical protein Efla_001109 [Eimeria flavescens]